MVYVDINPVSLDYESRYVEVQANPRSKAKNPKMVSVCERRPEVSVFGITVWIGEWSRDLYSEDYDIVQEWKAKWEEFLAMTFREWVKKNEAGKEDQGEGS